MSCLQGLAVYLSVRSDDHVSKDSLKRKIVELGGVFCPTLDKAQVVVSHNGKSNVTVDLAHTHGVPVVSPQWVDACHKSGVKVDYGPFLKDTQQQQQQPKAQLASLPTKASPPSPKKQPSKREREEKKPKSEDKKVSSSSKKVSGDTEHYVVVAGSEKEVLSSIVSQLGGHVVADPFKSKSTVTEVVVDNDVRTLKVLWAYAAGCPVVTHQWVLDSLCSESFVSTSSYLTSGCKAHLAARSKQHGKPSLMSGMAVTLQGEFSCPSKAEVEALITMVGGSVVTSMADAAIVICPTELRALPRAVRPTTPVVRFKWLADSIEFERLQDYAPYQGAMKGSADSDDDSDDDQQDNESSASEPESSPSQEDSASDHDAASGSESDTPIAKKVKKSKPAKKETSSTKKEQKPRESSKAAGKVVEKRPPSPVKHNAKKVKSSK